MEVKLVSFGSEAYQDTITLRDKILRKPLGLVFFQKDLDLEFDSFHLACYDEDNLVGCLVLKPISDDEIKMRQVAVDNAIQGKGIGSFLVQFCEDFSKERGFKRITLHARENAVPFYLKQSYEVIGDTFVEVGLPHFKMEKVISK